MPCTIAQRHSLVASVRCHRSLEIASEHVRPLRDVDREYILAARERNDGNWMLTAEQLEIGPARLFSKVETPRRRPWSLLLVAEAWTRVVEFIRST